jgi:hypothetical protein
VPVAASWHWSLQKSFASRLMKPLVPRTPRAVSRQSSPTWMDRPHASHACSLIPRILRAAASRYCPQQRPVRVHRDGVTAKVLNGIAVGLLHHVSCTYPGVAVACPRMREFVMLRQRLLIHLQAWTLDLKWLPLKWSTRHYSGSLFRIVYFDLWWR